MQKNYKYVIGIIVIILVLGLVYLAIPKHSSTIAAGIPGTGEPSGFDNVNLTGEIQVGVQPGNLAVTNTALATGTVYAEGDLIQGGQCSVSSVISTTTLNLTAAQLQCTQVAITNASSTQTLNVVLPASSTMTYLANAGDESDTFIYAASTTSGNLIVVAGTGFSIASPIGVASTTAASSTITAGNMGEFMVNRLSNTNMLGLIIPTK